MDTVRTMSPLPFLVRCVLAGLVCVGACAAQDLRYLSEQNWSTEDGLPQSSVHGVAQTKDGYIWAATEGGLARFDGVGFAVFGQASDGATGKAFKSDDLCCVLARGDGLWVGSSNGLVRMVGGAFRRYGVAEGLAAEFVLSLSEDTQGLLVETTSGWSRWDGRRFVSAQDGVAAWKVAGDVLSVRGVGRTWRLGSDLPAGRVTVVTVDRGGRVWIGMSRGLLVADVTTGKAAPVEALLGSSVLSVFEDAEGNHWVGTETTGLHILRQLKFRSENALSGLAVTAVAQAADGSMWAGTREEGLRRLHDGAWEPVDGLTSQVVLSLAPATGRKAGGVWVGTPDGLNLVDGNGAVQQITSAEGLPDDTIRSLTASPDGGVWAGTRRGLVHVRVEAGKLSVKVLTHADGLGDDLIGTMLLATGKWAGIWVATANGLSYLTDDGKIRNFGEREGLDGGLVKAVIEGPREFIWVMTEDNTLHRFEGKEFVRALQVDDRANKVEAMTPDRNGSVWLRMDRGVRRITFSAAGPCVANAECAAVVASYGLADGMPNSELVSGETAGPWLAANGEMWFPTRGGVAVADTLHLPVNNVPPPVVIERFVIDDVEQPLDGDVIEVKAGRSRLTIEYAAMSFVAPTEVRYKYMLENFDDHWTDAGSRRVATYTNLPPGKYRLRVIAMNDDDVWSPEGASVRLRVVPAFYRRWSFVAVCVVALCAMLAGLYLLRLRRLRQQFDAVLAERSRMAREIHDTLTQDFVGTSLQLDLMAQHLKSGKIETAMEDVRRTRLMVTEGLEEARRSIWELRANQAQDSLPTRLSNLVERDRFLAIRPQLKVGGAYRGLEPQVEREVMRVAQEALANVSRHAEATACRVELRYASEELVLSVSDNGKGFAMQQAASKDGHFGLMGMRERAASIGGTLVVASEIGVGTSVTLRVPLEATK